MLKAFVFTILIALSTSSSASDEATVLFTIVDEQQQPIPKAWIQFTNESTKHAVNTETGAARFSHLYTDDDDERVISKEMMLDFETGAPGFKTQNRSYRVVKKKAAVTITLLKTHDVVVDKERFAVFLEGLWANWVKPDTHWWGEHLNSALFNARVLHSDGLMGYQAFIDLLAQRSTSEFNETIRIDHIDIPSMFKPADGHGTQLETRAWANAFVTLIPGEGPPQRAHIFVLAERPTHTWVLRQFHMTLLESPVDSTP